VREGTIVGTVVQNPYEWGYQGMKLMAKHLEGDDSGIPGDKLIIVPGQVITKDNVDSFETELKARISG
jgi:ribose transport system substrate-binding protein